jgi:hypothetical protein
MPLDSSSSPSLGQEGKTLLTFAWGLALIITSVTLYRRHHYSYLSMRILKHREIK